MNNSTVSWTTQKVIQLEKNHQLPGFQSIADLAGIVVDRALNAEIWDIEGKRYIDFFTGVGVCSIGHSNPKYVQRVSDQLGKCIVGAFYTETRAKYFSLLSQQLPNSLNKIQMYSTGSEANEAAIKLVKAATGKHEIVSFWGGFHGKTQATLSLHGGDRKHGWGPMFPGFSQTPYAYCYRCPFDLKYPGCEFHCVDFAEQFTENNTTGDIAAIIVEPIQGTNGNIIPPNGYIRKLRELADKYQALLILDEVITGFGRTGKMFAFEHEPGVIPDVLVLGKSMASGVPTSAVVSRSELVQDTIFGQPSAAASTFGGNPLSSAASLATLEIIIEDKLVEQSRMLGQFVESRICSWMERFPIVGNAKNLGLMIGIELVETSSKQPLRKNITRAIFQELMARGVLAMAYGSKIRLYPPLSISKSLLEEGFMIIEDVFDNVNRTMVSG